MKRDYSFLQGVVATMHSARTDAELLNLVIDKCIEYTNASSGTMITITGDNFLEIQVVRGFAEHVQSDVRLQVGEGITGWVALHGKPYLCHDTETDPHYYRIKGGIRSELAVPMIAQGKTIGVLNLDSRRKDAFDETQLDTLMILAATAALVHNKVQDIERLDAKIRYQDILIEVAERLSDAGSLSSRFRAIMGILQERIGLERGTIVLRRAPNEYAIHTAVGLTPEEIKKGVYHPGEGVTGTIMQTGEAIAVRDVYADDRFLDKTSARRKKTGGRGAPLSFIGVPIRMHSDTVGVLSADKPFDNKRYDDDISLLRVLASLLAQALQVEELSAQEKKRLLEENAHLKEEVQTQVRAHHGFDQFVGISQAMLEVYRKIELVADSEATALVTGESGTGKELVADAIHKRSRRAAMPLVKINCSAIPDTLLESELFGHTKGAFTGANVERKGRIQLADHGTLFLDEIGDMPVSMQTKLLRVLQQKEVDVIGGSAPIPVDVRVIAATSRKLEQMLKEGTFREDLYYRLNVFRIDLPPLRERREDVELIARDYLKRLATREGVPYAGIAYEALARIAALPLEGNVRELQNILEQAFLIAGKGQIEEFHLNLPRVEPALPGNILPGAPGDDAAGADGNGLFHPGALLADPPAQHGQVWRLVMGEVERRLIEWALGKTDGNRSEAARFLGINRNTLNAKLSGEEVPAPGAKVRRVRASGYKHAR